MNECHACDYEDDEGDYITKDGLCLDCAAFMNAYDCSPDCRERAKCWEEGPTHTQCGTCFTCFRPNHHCTPDTCRPYFDVSPFKAEVLQEVEDRIVEYLLTGTTTTARSDSHEV